jgi:cellulose synthase/poly-beta-1,6-N-acetylglucosamine synthase-like glycosyltransferase
MTQQFSAVLTSVQQHIAQQNIVHTDITSTLGQVGDFVVTILPYIPIAIAGTVVWLLWLYRVVRSATAPAIVSDFSTTTSVIVPSFHEDPDILMRCLKSWREQNPTEIIIVLDVADLGVDERHLHVGEESGRPRRVGVGENENFGCRLANADTESGSLAGVVEQDGPNTVIL